MNLVTQEGITVALGQHWTALFERDEPTCEVVDLSNECATLQTPLGRKTIVAIVRMHKHSTGWQLCR